VKGPIGGLSLKGTKMPLSEQEQRLLEEMERSLYNNDSDFVTTMGSRHGRPSYTMVVLGILGALVGIGVIVAGVALRQPLVGVAGFVVLLAGALFAIAPPRRRHGLLGPAPVPPQSSTGRGARGRGNRGSMMDRLNERWDRRQGGDGQ
jgi:hypothetical protein